MPKTVKLSAAKQAAFFASYRERLIAAVKVAERANIKDGAAALVEASSGTFSTADLRRAGHPYAVRAPNDAYDPSIINAQTGDFRAGWKAQEPTVEAEPDAATITTTCPNFDPKAKFMAGTARMVARAVIQRAYSTIADTRKARIARAFQSAIKPGDTT